MKIKREKQEVAITSTLLFLAPDKEEKKLP